MTSSQPTPSAPPAVSASVETLVRPIMRRDRSLARGRRFGRPVPLGRVGTAEDCVGTYLFLASESLSGYITGQMIDVNGGQLMP